MGLRAHWSPQGCFLICYKTTAKDPPPHHHTPHQHCDWWSTAPETPFSPYWYTLYHTPPIHSSPTYLCVEGDGLYCASKFLSCSGTKSYETLPRASWISSQSSSFLLIILFALKVKHKEEPPRAYP